MVNLNTVDDISGEMIFPNYDDGNLVNLVGAIFRGLGRETSLPALPGIEPQVKQAKNTIFLLIDGLGNDCVQGMSHTSFLKRHYQRSLTTVFPSTTTAVLFTILTGQMPAEHGLPAWDLFFPEVGSVVEVLPFRSRFGAPLPTKYAPFLLPAETIFSQLKTDNHILTSQSHVARPYLQNLPPSTTIKGVGSLEEFVGSLSEIVTAPSTSQRAIFAYWEQYDLLCHRYGKSHTIPTSHLLSVDAALEKLAATLKRTNTLLLITADHGHMETTAASVINLAENPLRRYLALPLCGEPRAAFCYIHLERQEEFARYVENNLATAAILVKSQELVEQGIFGNGEIHPYLHERIGDFVLIAKSNHIFSYYFPYDDPPYFSIGNHGGLSEEEMMIPLVAIWC